MTKQLELSTIVGKAAMLALQRATRSYVTETMKAQQLRDAAEPEWPEMIDPAGMCPACNWSYNFGPASHPVLKYRGVGCCECGAAFRVSAYGDRLETEEMRPFACISMESLGFSQKEQDALIAQYGVMFIYDYCPGLSNCMYKFLR